MWIDKSVGCLKCILIRDDHQHAGISTQYFREPTVVSGGPRHREGASIDPPCSTPIGPLWRQKDSV